MIKYKIVLEYDGTNYSGWQAQKNARSIQGALIDAAEKFLDMPVEIQGAGRTDAGVHALGQVAHLETTRKLNSETLRIGLNDLLPAGINVLTVENASPALSCPPFGRQPQLSVSDCYKAHSFRQKVRLVGQRQTAYRQNASGAGRF